MTTSINLHLSNFWFEIGWFPGNQFKLFELTIFGTVDGYPGGIDTITFFGFDILLFSFSFGWSRN